MSRCYTSYLWMVKLQVMWAFFFLFQVLLQNLILLIEQRAREYNSVINHKLTMFKAPGLIPRSPALGEAGKEQKSPKLLLK